jgi:hypothetical protein
VLSASSRPAARVVPPPHGAPMPQFRPAFFLAARVATRNHLRRSGKSFRQINAAMDNISNEEITAAAVIAADTGPLPDLAVEPDPGVSQALGDGKILEALLKFFESDLGQALIKILLSFLGL